MNEDDVPRDLLDLKIRQIQFQDRGGISVYTTQAALHAILRTPEVVTFMKAQHFEWPFPGEPVEGLHTQPSPNLPHLSGTLDDVTVSQALDYVLQTFPGVWIYENCPGSDQKGRVVFFHFFRPQNAAER
jgi:hypothetical protein